MPNYSSKQGNHFCSQECTHIFRITERISLNCALCKKQFHRRKREYDIVEKRNGKHFCSRKCCMLYGHGNPVVEIKFAEKLDEMGLEYLRNDRKLIKPLELDFYIDSIKCAVEINGPAHYRDIWGVRALRAQKKRDAKKVRLCKEKGIALFVIKIVDVSPKKYDKLFGKTLAKIKNIAVTGSEISPAKSEE